MAGASFARTAALLASWCTRSAQLVLAQSETVFLNAGQNVRTCPSGFEDITTQRDCSLAAAALGYGDALCCMPAGSWTDWPYGCFYKSSNNNLHMNSYHGSGNPDGSLLCKKSQRTGGALPSWLPMAELEDYECRTHMSMPVVDWNELRSAFRAIARGGLDEHSLTPVNEDAAAAAFRKRAQLDMLLLASAVLTQFSRALAQCPLGALTASLYATCYAHLRANERSQESLPEPLTAILVELQKKDLKELLLHDLAFLFDAAPVQITAATEWSVFHLLTMFIGRLELPAVMKPGPLDAANCVGSSVAGYSSEHIQKRLLKHLSYASGTSIGGLKFLRALDELVTRVMGDPSQFTFKYIPACPPGAAAFAISATMLALMSNLAVFDQFVKLANSVLRQYLDDVLDGAFVWDIFHGLAKLGSFATRAFDMEWTSSELFTMPESLTDFDALRLDTNARSAHIVKASTDHHLESTRQLAKFLLSAQEHHKNSGAGSEFMVYLTSVGGSPFADHIHAFIRRAITVRLPALVIACMDSQAQSKCEGTVSTEEVSMLVYCVPKFESHLIFVKYAFIPVILSAAVDVVWIDFDTYILQNPTSSLQQARDAPEHILPLRSRIRFGSSLFDNASHICSTAKICDPRSHWAHTVTGADDSSSDEGVEMLVTEHWDAKCLNNGLFYVRATHRPLTFFMMYISQLYRNPYADNQNMFDAFLAHSTIDATVPETRPLLRYALLDVGRKFACAEGHAGDVSELVTFHFWSADTKTREAVPGETSDNDAEKITARDGTQRVLKAAIASKRDLFDLFFGSRASTSDGISDAAIAFIEQVKAPLPAWKGMCAVSAVGIEDLLDENLLRNQQTLPDWVKETVGSGHGPTMAMPEEPKSLADQPAQCDGIPLQAWSGALRRIAELEDSNLLSLEEAGLLKKRLRSLDIGCLLSVQSFESYGFERLAIELRGMLRA